MKSNQAKYVETPSPNVYHDKNFNISAVKILPGEYYVTKRDLALVTVLGSCVAACIRDRDSGMGGMNHFMLPGDSGNVRAGLVTNCVHCLDGPGRAARRRVATI